MKFNQLTVAVILSASAAIVLGADAASAPVAAASSSVSTAAIKLTAEQYVIASVISAVGNLIHFFKKNVTDETDSAAMKYFQDHKLAMLIGVVVAIICTIGQAATLFKSTDGLWLTALLTGYAADSIFGKYTPATSIIKQT